MIMADIQTNTQIRQDEIQEYSLLDLIVVLSKHRKLFIYTTLIITLLGAIFAGMTHLKKSYVYRQPVQLASYFSDGKQFLLQGNAQIMSAVNNLYLPRFLEQYRTQHVKFNDARFIENFNVQSSFEQTQGQIEAPSNTIYFEYKGNENDLPLFQQAVQSILLQIQQQEHPMMNSLLNTSKANLLLMQTEVPKLEKVGELLKDYSATKNNDMHQEIAMTVSTRETYLDLISQSQTVQNVIQFKQAANDLTQKIESLTPSTMGPLIIIAGKPAISFMGMVLLSFIVGLFIALLLVFIKAISGTIRAQLKLAK
jgi:hypothetical protein